MRTVEVVPKHIVVLTEFSIEELVMLKQGLESTQLTLNMQNEKDRAISEFMTKDLYEYVESLLKEIGIDND